MVKILRNETPVQEIQRLFREELEEKLKEAALQMKCPVEHLKYRFSNDGVVEIQMMTPQELRDLPEQEKKNKRIIQIKKQRGVLWT